MRSIRILSALLCFAGGCALGDDGVNPRGRDGAVDGAPPGECDPPCATGEVCQDGTCVPDDVDGDGDGITVATDCDDADPAVGTTSEQVCTGPCGEGLTHCTDGVWTECDAPTTCDCTAGSAPRQIPCEQCGMQTQNCVGGVWTNDGVCMGQGECAPGAVEDVGACGSCGTSQRTCQTSCTWGAPVCMGEGGECTSGAVESRSVACGACGEGTRLETRTCSGTCTWGAWGGGTCNTSATCMPGQMSSEMRACTTGCGGNQTRTRTCNATTCTWNIYGAWSTCATSCCGDMTCGSGETCSSCADCRAGHQGSGNNGDSCVGVPDEQWRCVQRTSDGAWVSQVCRNDAWLSFHLSPRNCAACMCAFSTSCCQAGSTAPGCV